jgi:hypothetical protein
MEWQKVVKLDTTTAELSAYKTVAQMVARRA